MVSMEMFVFTTDGIQQLHEWAHASISMVLDHLSTFPAADYQKELPGFGFSTLQKQVVHIFNCEGFWIHVIKGLPYVDRDPATCSDVADARLLQQQVSRWTEEYCWPSRINNSTLMRNFVSRMEISPYALLRSSSITFLRTRSITKGR
jgi:DinB family